MTDKKPPTQQKQFWSQIESNLYIFMIFFFVYVNERLARVNFNKKIYNYINFI